MSGFGTVVGRVARKELTELFRDGRSMLITVLVPVALFPMLFILLDTNIEQQRAIGEKNRVIAVSQETREVLTQNGLLERLAEYTLLGTTTPTGLSDGVPEPDTPLSVATDLSAAAILFGDAVAAIESSGRIRYNDRSEISTAAAFQLAATLNATPLSSGTEESGDVVAAGTGVFTMEPLLWTGGASATGGVSGTGARPATGGAPGVLLSLAAIVPLFLLLAGAVGPLPAALDLGAGEKQRQSLEFLLSTTRHRSAIFLGKAIATTVTGYIGTISFILGIVLADMAVPDILSTSDTALVFTGTVLARIAPAVLILVALISVLELLLSFVARSPREAQGYFLPLLVACSGIGYTVLFTDVWYAPPWMLHVPLLNTALLVKMSVLGIGDSAIRWWVYLENFIIFSMISYIGGTVLHSERVLRRS